jgi:hypothetical protein
VLHEALTFIMLPSARVTAALFVSLLPASGSALSWCTSSSPLTHCSSAAISLRARPVVLQATEGEQQAAAPPAWFEEEEQSGPLAPPPPPAPLEEDLTEELLSVEDLENTMWDLVVTPREDGWLSAGDKQQQFTLLADSTVVWGGTAGGFGTGGRWTLRENLLEVVRTTSGNFPGLSLLTGRDYYMSAATVDVDDKLQFKLSGIIRSYNALYPTMVIADFKATRRPGRFVRDIEEDEE